MSSVSLSPFSHWACVLHHTHAHANESYAKEQTKQKSKQSETEREAIKNNQGFKLQHSRVDAPVNNKQTKQKIQTKEGGGEVQKHEGGESKQREKEWRVGSEGCSLLDCVRMASTQGA